MGLKLALDFGLEMSNSSIYTLLTNSSFHKIFKVSNPLRVVFVHRSHLRVKSCPIVLILFLSVVKLLRIISNFGVNHFFNTGFEFSMFPTEKVNTE